LDWIIHYSKRVQLFPFLLEESSKRVQSSCLRILREWLCFFMTSLVEKSAVADFLLCLDDKPHAFHCLCFLPSKKHSFLHNRRSAWDKWVNGEDKAMCIIVILHKKPCIFHWILHESNKKDIWIVNSWMKSSQVFRDLNV